MAEVWDHARDHEPIAKHLTAIFRLMTPPTFGTRPGLVSGCESVPENHTVFEYVLRDRMCHLPQSIQSVSPDDATTLIMDCTDATVLLELHWFQLL